MRVSQPGGGASVEDIWSADRSGWPTGSFGEFLSNPQSTVAEAVWGWSVRTLNVTDTRSAYTQTNHIITSAAAAGAFGAWRELYPFGGVYMQIYLLVVRAPGVSGATQAEIEIGYGSAGSEIAVLRVNIPLHTSPETHVLPVPFIRIGLTRWAARVRDDVATANDYWVAAHAWKPA